MANLVLSNSCKKETEIGNGDIWRWNRRRAASDFVLVEGTNSLDAAPGISGSRFKTRRASISESTSANNVCVNVGHKNKKSLPLVSYKKFELPYYAPRTSSPKSLFEQVGLIRRSAKLESSFVGPQCCEQDQYRASSEASSQNNRLKLDSSSQTSTWSFCAQQNFPSPESFQVVGVNETKRTPEQRSPVTDIAERSESQYQSNNVCYGLDRFLRILSGIAGEEITTQVVVRVGVESVLSMLPLIVWFLVFNFYPRLSLSWRPSINTNLLPKLEGLLHFPYRWFATRSSKAADFVAAVPYTIHAVLPGLFFLYLLLTDGRKEAFCFFASLGVLNTSAVLTQILFPFAPPWYFELNGLAKAEHWMSGNPGAALARVDKLFGIVFYQETYTTQNRIPFGSFPSLHAAWPSLVAFCFPTRGSHLFKVLATCYVCLIYWAAMYLQHHYVIDLLGGTLYAYLTYRMVFARKLDIPSLFFKTQSNDLTEKDLTYSSGKRPPLQPAYSRNVVSSTSQDSLTNQRKSTHHLGHYS
ncbi:Inositol phosphorylceramide synthase [Galdieria sulphuraria]|nr:Inositol phosphorylceramide synthase [Galdieria sulphuraria]